MAMQNRWDICPEFFATKKASSWNRSDGEGRKRGEQRGLDKPFLQKRLRKRGAQVLPNVKRVLSNVKRTLKTPVVLAVNDAR